MIVKCFRNRYVGRCAFEYWVQIVEDTASWQQNHDRHPSRFSNLEKLPNGIYEPVTESRCLRVEPSWMYENKELIGDMRLKDILITGTHDAAAFK